MPEATSKPVTDSLKPGPQPEASKPNPEVGDKESIRASHERKVTAFESIRTKPGEVSGEKKVGDVYADAVRKRLENPADARWLQKRHVFTELSGAHTAVNEILAANSSSPMESAKLAGQLRERVKAVYINKGVGLEEFDALTDAQIIADAKDFSGTVARELFMEGVLDARVNVQDAQQQIKELSYIDSPDKKVNRGDIVGKVSRAKRERTREARGLGYLDHELKLDPSERSARRTALERQYGRLPRRAGEPTPEDKAKVKATVESDIIKRVTGREITDPTSLSPEDQALLARIPERLKQDAVDAQAKVIASRKHLAEVGITLNTGDIVKAINNHRSSEGEYRGASKSLGIEAIRQKRAEKINSVLKDKAGTIDASGNLTSQTISTALNLVGANLRDKPREVAEKLLAPLKDAAKFVSESNQRQANFVKRGADSLRNNTFGKAGAIIDRARSAISTKVREFHAWRGNPTALPDKMARSEAFHTSQFRQEIGNGADCVAPGALVPDFASVAGGIVSTGVLITVNCSVSPR